MASSNGTAGNTTNGQKPPTVLIVGAGPTGLILGIELLRRDIPIRLVDKQTGPTTSSRAFTVHSRSLEATDILGLTSALKEHGGGVHAKSMQYHFVPGDDKRIVKTLNLNFCNDVVRGRHSGILTVPQTVTERVLREGFEKLGGKVEWGTEVIGFVEKGDGVEVELVKSGDQPGDEMTGGKGGEKVQVEYMIGCDGARSFVRKKQNLEFSGLHYAGMTMKMMDVSLNGTLDHAKFDEDGYHYLIKEKSMLLMAKMGDVEDYKGDTDVWRVLLSTTEEKPDTSLESFQAGVDRVIDGVKLGKPHWTVAYRIHKRMVSEYQSEKGRILLAGDAAHINSPAGGQGMNTAIQDGFNLGWKLAMVCKGMAKPDILKTYEVERKPVAKKVLEGTDLLHSVMMAHGKKLKDRIEKASAEHWLEKAVLRISGQAFKYGKDEEEDLIGNDVVVADGDYAPDILVVSKADGGRVKRLSEVNAQYYILVVFGENQTDAASKLKDKYGQTLTVVSAAGVDAQGANTDYKKGTLDAPSEDVLKSQYGECVAALVRPDRYIETIIKNAADVEDQVAKGLSYVAV